MIAIPEPLRDKLGAEGAQARFERRLAEEIAAVRSEIGAVRVELATTKAELIRWMFIFWIGQVGATLGILFAFFRS